MHVEKLSKQYHLRSGGRERYSTLRDSIMNVFKLQRNHDRREGVFWALKDISFDVKPGEVMGIIGRNGAGKSTLLKIISRISSPTRGVIDLHGRVGSLLEVGTGFHPELSGRENVYLNGAILGMQRSEIDRKFDEIISFAGTEKFIDTPVKHYSTGMYLRLAFSVAAHIETEILLVDEILAVGDADFQKKCLNKMSDVAQEGRTVLFVSHNMAAIRSLCTSGIVLDRGEMRFYGEIRDAVQFYGNLVTARDQQETLNVADVGFTNVRVAGENTDGITTGAPFKASCTLHLQVALPGFQLFCILQNEFGEVLVHGHNTGLEAHAAVPGIYQIDVSFPALWFRPGLYSLHFKLMASGLASGKARFVSNTIPVDVTGTVTGEALHGTLTPDLHWHMVGTSLEVHVQESKMARP